MMGAKVYVQVNADFNTDGIMLPRELFWEDGEKYTIDRVVDICQTAAMKAGGQGGTYIIEVRRLKRYDYRKTHPFLCRLFRRKLSV